MHLRYRCSITTEADLASADLSGATFKTARYDAGINFDNANLTSADLSGSTMTAMANYGEALIGFNGANLNSANLSGSTITTKATNPTPTGWGMLHVGWFASV